MYVERRAWQHAVGPGRGPKPMEGMEISQRGNAARAIQTHRWSNALKKSARGTQHSFARETAKEETVSPKWMSKRTTLSVRRASSVMTNEQLNAGISSARDATSRGQRLRRRGTAVGEDTLRGATALRGMRRLVSIQRVNTFRRGRAERERRSRNATNPFRN